MLARHDAEGVRWDYVHAGHSVGWLRDAKLTPPMSLEEARALRDGPQVAIERDGTKTEGGRVFRMGVSLPRGAGAGVKVPTSQGFIADALVEAPANPDIRLQTQGKDPGALADQVVAYLEANGYLQPA